RRSEPARGGRPQRVSELLPAPPATPTPAAATATEAASAAAAFAPTAFGTRPRFIDVHASALQVGAIQGGDRCFGFFLVRHLDEAETFGLPAELVFDDRRRIDLPVRRESVAELVFCDLVGQVPHVDLHALSLS